MRQIYLVQLGAEKYSEQIDRPLRPWQEMKGKKVNRIQDGIQVYPETTRMSGHNKFDEINK